MKVLPHHTHPQRSSLAACCCSYWVQGSFTGLQVSTWNCPWLSLFHTSEVCMPQAQHDHEIGNGHSNYISLRFMWINLATEPFQLLDVASGMSCRGGSDILLVWPPSSRHWRPISTVENSSLYLPNFLTLFFPGLPGAHRAFGWLRLKRPHYYYWLRPQNGETITAKERGAATGEKMRCSHYFNFH